MSKKCPECGEELLDNAKFCKHCGAKLDAGESTAETTFQQAPQTYQQPMVEENKHTAAVVLGYIFAILIPIIGLIIGVYLITRNDSESAKFHGKIVLALSTIIWGISILLLNH